MLSSDGNLQSSGQQPGWKSRGAEGAGLEVQKVLETERASVRLVIDAWQPDSKNHSVHIAK